VNAPKAESRLLLGVRCAMHARTDNCAWFSDVSGTPFYSMPQISMLRKNGHS